MKANEKRAFHYFGKKPRSGGGGGGGGEDIRYRANSAMIIYRLIYVGDAWRIECRIITSF